MEKKATAQTKGGGPTAQTPAAGQAASIKSGGRKNRLTDYTHFVLKFEIDENDMAILSRHAKAIGYGSVRALLQQGVWDVLIRAKDADSRRDEQ